MNKVFIHETNNELFSVITGNTYPYKNTIKDKGSGIWINELKGWLVQSSKIELLKEIDLTRSYKIDLDTKILNKLIECDTCNARITLHSMDTHHMFCGIFAIIAYNCKNGKILTEDTFKYKDMIKKFNGKFIKEHNCWYLSNSDYCNFKNSIKNIDIIENNDAIYNHITIDNLDKNNYLFD